MPISQNLWVKPGAADGATTYASLLYPLINEDSVDINHALFAAELYMWLPGNVDVAHALVGGTLLQPLSTYGNWPAEKVDVTHAFTAGVLQLVLKTYSNWPVEKVDVVHAFLSGILSQILFIYSNWPVEKVDTTHAFIGGTLT
jgi:hypothetical protein